MARNIPEATKNVRMLSRKKYKDKAPTDLSTESTKEPDEFDLWQSTISQAGDEFDPFIDSNPILLGESLSLWLEEVQRRHLSEGTGFVSN